MLPRPVVNILSRVDFVVAVRVSWSKECGVRRRRMDGWMGVGVESFATRTVEVAPEFASGTFVSDAL